MADVGVRVANVDEATIVDQILGVLDGSVRLIVIERLVALLMARLGPTYATRAELFADLDWPDGVVGYVSGDPTAGYNGIYRKDGATGAGSWTRVGDLPTSAVEASQIAAVASDLAAEITRAQAAEAGKVDGGSLLTDETGTVFVDGSGGQYGHISPDGAEFVGLAGAADGSGQVGNVEVDVSDTAAIGGALADAHGGAWADLAGDAIRIGSQIMTPTAVLLSSGRMIAAEPITPWVGPGAADAPLSDTVAVATAQPVSGITGYTPPVITTDRYYRSGYDLADMMTPMIPSVDIWPGGRKIRVCFGQTGIPAGESGEGSGSYVRVSVEDGVNWRHVLYIVPTDWDNQSVADAYVTRLADGRALIVYPHNDGYHLRPTGIVIQNPTDDPANWIIGEQHRLCDATGWPSMPTMLDNGELVGTVYDTRFALSAPYADGTGVVFGYYTIGDDNSVVFTEVSEVPRMEPGNTYNSFAECNITQVGSDELFLLFRTALAHHYTTSTDRGQTWTPPAEYTLLPTLSAKAHMDRLPDGRLIAMTNASGVGTNRRNMTLHISDVGASPLDDWPISVLLDSRSWVTYPNAKWVPDDWGRWRGEIIAAYDHGRGTLTDPDGDYYRQIVDIKTNIHALVLGLNHFDIREISK